LYEFDDTHLRGELKEGHIDLLKAVCSSGKCEVGREAEREVGREAEREVGRAAYDFNVNL
jgi:hypothetical protein